MNVIRSALDWLGWDRVSETKRRHEELIKIMATLLERLAAVESGLDGLSEDLTEGLGEVTTEIAKLREQLGTVTPEVEATLARIEGKLGTTSTTAKAIADIIPNAPTAES
jgi:septation ring formation regulator EzrA